MPYCHTCRKAMGPGDEILPGYCSLACSDKMSERKWHHVRSQAQSEKVEQPTSVRAFLEQIGLEMYADQFEEHQITVALLPQLTSDDLREVGVSALGHRKKILTAFTRTKAQPPRAKSSQSYVSVSDFDAIGSSIHPTPVGLITTVWILVAISFLPLPYFLAFVTSLAILISGIVLVVNRNMTAKINGGIVLGLWVVTFLIGFMLATTGVYRPF